jgi:hypothetical protein
LAAWDYLGDAPSGAKQMIAACREYDDRGPGAFEMPAGVIA